MVCDISAPILCEICNDEIINSKHFPEKLTVADVVAGHKKEDSTFIKKYRPV